MKRFKIICQALWFALTLPEVSGIVVRFRNESGQSASRIFHVGEGE